MQITYTTTSSSLVLIDDTLARPGKGWEGIMQQLLGDGGGIGKASSPGTACGNRARPLAGTVSRKFADHAAAVAFWMAHEAALPDSGDLVVSVGGTTIGTWAGASLESVRVSPPDGCSLTVTYQFRLAAPATMAS